MAQLEDKELSRRSTMSDLGLLIGQKFRKNQQQGEPSDNSLL
jgi:hypothetical protein